MHEVQHKDIIIDEDFKRLIQPVDKIELNKLETDICNNGLDKKLPIWKNQLLMGFQIYEICQNNSVPYETEEITLSNKTSAQSWICSEQLNRSDLTEEYKKYLIGKKFEFELILSKKENNPHRIKSKNHVKKSKYRIAKKIADDLEISYSTVLKYNLYSTAIDTISSVQPELADMILIGSLKISHERAIALSQQNPTIIIKIMEKIKKSPMNHIAYTELTNELEFKPVNQSQKNTLSDDEPGIRKMPEYDPDAELSSLALTIPSWVSSMERAHRHTEYHKTSSSARINLIKQLGILERTINLIQTEIEGLF